MDTICLDHPTQPQNEIKRETFYFCVINDTVWTVGKVSIERDRERKSLE